MTAEIAKPSGDDGVLFVDTQLKKLRKRLPLEEPIVRAGGCAVRIKYRYRCECGKMYLVHNTRGKDGPVEYVTCCPCGARDRIIFRER